MAGRPINSTTGDPRVIDIGQRVAHRRKAQEMSQAELARRAGLSRTSVHTLEAGTGCPNVGTLLIVADVLKSPVEDFVKGM